MRIGCDGDVLTAALAADCRIFEVEAHLELARGVDWASPAWSTCIVEAGAVTDMDTAYFQLLLAMRQSSLAGGKAFILRDPAAAVREIAALYGLGEALGLCLDINDEDLRIR